MGLSVAFHNLKSGEWMVGKLPHSASVEADSDRGETEGTVTSYWYKYGLHSTGRCLKATESCKIVVKGGSWHVCGCTALAEQHEPRLVTCELVGRGMGVPTFPVCTWKLLTQKGWLHQCLEIGIRLYHVNVTKLFPKGFSGEKWPPCSLQHWE